MKNNKTSECGAVFQSLEKTRKSFPIIGKIAGLFSKPWKIGWTALLAFLVSCAISMGAGDVVPSSGPHAGGNTVLVTNAVPSMGDGSDITNVLVGGVAAVVTGQGVNWVSLVMPAHAAGLVDIVVQSASVGETTLAGAYTYNPNGEIGVAGNPAQHTIAGGYYHSLGLKLDGTVVCWGSDDYGQCTVPEPNASFVSVGAGRYHSLGVKADGTVVCWGDNGYGQCTPPDPNTGFVAAEGGRYHSVAVRSDGTVAAWGRNNYFQCDVPAPNTNFTAVSGGYYHCAGLKSDGSIVCWGANGDGQCDVPEPNTNFIAVAAGYYHSAGLKADGTVVCWGYNGDGQCTVPEPNANFIAIGAGLYHTMGLKADGTIVCWGYNDDNQCDVPDPNANFAAVARGLYHTLGMKADGVVVCWGMSGDGQCDVPEPNSGFNPGGSSGVSPSSGSITGGYAVVITGSNLGDGADVTNVTLCGVGVAGITDQSATQMVVMASPGPMGRGDVRVFSTSFGETIRSNGFTYTVAALSVLGVNGETIVSGEAASVAKGTEFGVKYGLTNRVSLTLTNIGNGSLTISGVATSGTEAALFDVEGYPSSLAGYGTGPLTVACRGEALGPCAATMTVTFDGTNSPYEVGYKVWGYQASAYTGPSAGGNLLTITYAASGSGDITNVLVDGVAAVIDGQADGWVRIVMPAHAVGAVSLVVQSVTLNEVLNNAYTYNPAGWIGGPRVDAWVPVQGLPVPRSGMGGAQVSNEMFVVG
ncbi:MAG: IPT/TIG domain-containing protein, partial [Lentisphaerota bacterium]